MRWVKFLERFPGSADKASLDIDDDVIIKSDDTFLVRNLSELLNVVSLDDEWLEVIEVEPAKKCENCLYFDKIAKPINSGVCRKRPPTKTGWPQTWLTDWCGEFRQK